MINESDSTSNSFRTGSIWERSDRKYAARMIADGGLVGVFNRGVNAIWVDGQNLEAIGKMQAIKGEARVGRPVALTIGFDRLTTMIDSDALTDEVRRFLMITEDIKDYLGSLCFLRVPLKEEYRQDVPVSSLSTDTQGRYWIQTWDPFGHEPTEDLIKIAESLGVKFPAVTSMNINGQPEIVDQNEGEEFSQKSGIPIYLRDPKIHDRIKGSYTIITLGERGAEVTRDGNIPYRVLQPIFGLSLYIDNMASPKYPQMEFPDSLITGLSSREIRVAILRYINGEDSEQVNRLLREQRV